MQASVADPAGDVGAAGRTSTGGQPHFDPGDRVFFEPGEDHRHGAASNRLMTHLAMLEVDDGGNPATWGGHVTDEARRRRQ